MFPGAVKWELIRMLPRPPAGVVLVPVTGEMHRMIALGAERPRAGRAPMHAAAGSSECHGILRERAV